MESPRFGLVFEAVVVIVVLQVLHLCVFLEPVDLAFPLDRLSPHLQREVHPGHNQWTPCSTADHLLEETQWGSRASCVANRIHLRLCHKKRSCRTRSGCKALAQSRDFMF